MEGARSSFELLPHERACKLWFRFTGQLYSGNLISSSNNNYFAGIVFGIIIGAEHNRPIILVLWSKQHKVTYPNTKSIAIAIFIPLNYILSDDKCMAIYSIGYDLSGLDHTYIYIV